MSQALAVSESVRLRGLGHFIKYIALEAQHRADALKDPLARDGILAKCEFVGLTAVSIDTIINPRFVFSRLGLFWGNRGATDYSYLVSLHVSTSAAD
ncbi:MAG: hypothetical protein Q7J24_10410 [Desulfomicrobium sp.]|nr:hypothetical protein [Desulfomicrobium sp.]MDP3429942.1 hypothetical protein [Desulfomicrobium sp.]